MSSQTIENNIDQPLVQSLKLTLEGHSETDIREWLSKQFPEVEASKIFNQIPEFLKESASQDQEVILGFCLESTRDLYRKMLEIGDFSGCLKAVSTLAKLSKQIQPKYAGESDFEFEPYQ